MSTVSATPTSATPPGVVRALAVVVLAVACALGLMALMAPAATAQEAVTPARVEGDDRIDTAALVAEVTYSEGTDVALLARADDYPDALAAASLAGAVSGPVLLTGSGDLPPRTQEALDTLGVTDVFVLGGRAAITSDVFETLLDLGYNVERLGGDTRYETAAEVAAETDVQGEINELVGDARTFFLAYGGSFEDALAAGAPGAAAIIPTLLTGQDDLPDATVEAIDELNLEYAYVLGGPLAISDQVVDQLEALGVGTRRLAGQTAQGTATQIAEEFAGLLQGPTTVLARGDVFADALSAGPHAGAIAGPILLTVDPGTLGEATRTYLADPPNDIEAVRAIGGTEAITVETLDTAVAIAGSEDMAETQQTYVVTPQEALSLPVPGVADFSTARRYDGEPIGAATLDIALLPCDAADVVGDGPDTFLDDNDDGVADELGSTATGNASIATLNDTDVPDEDIKTDVVVRDGRVTWSVASVRGSDCAVTVIWDDEDGDGLLDVGGSDVGEVPVEPYGVGQVTFEN